MQRASPMRQLMVQTSDLEEASLMGWEAKTVLYLRLRICKVEGEDEEKPTQKMMSFPGRI